jgi:hypothetical protein
MDFCAAISFGCPLECCAKKCLEVENKANPSLFECAPNRGVKRGEREREVVIYEA